MRENRDFNKEGFASVLNEATDVERHARPGVVVGLFADHLVEHRAFPGLAFACLESDEVECVDPLRPGFIGMDEFPANGRSLATEGNEATLVECRELDAVARARLERNRGKTRVIRRPGGKPAAEALTVMPPQDERTAAAQPVASAPEPAPMAVVKPVPVNGKANGVTVAKPVATAPVAVAKPGNGNGHLPHLPAEVWQLVPAIADGLRAGKQVLVRDLARELRIPLLRHLCRVMRAVCDFVPQADGAVEYRLRPARSR